MHGRSREHAPPSATGTWQVGVAPTQFMFWPQPWFAHESPGFGSAAHVPHSVFGGTAQNPEEHCAANEHGEPSAPDPFGAMHAVGGLTPDKNCGHA